MWRQLSIAVGLAMVVGSIALFFMPVHKTVTVWLRLARTQPGLLADVSESWEDFSAFKRNQIELIRSPLVLSATVRHPNIKTLPTITEQENPERWLKQQLIFDLPGEYEMMRVSLKGRNAQDLATILNTAFRYYFETLERISSEKNRGIVAVLRNEYDSRTINLKFRMSELHALEREHKVSSAQIAAASELTAHKIEAALDERRDLRRKKSDVERKIKINDAREDDGIKTAADGHPNDTSRWLLNLENRLLQDELVEVETLIEECAKDPPATFDNFSADVAMKQEELRREKDLVNELAVRITHLELESGAPRRIYELQTANVKTAESDDTTRRRNGATLLALCGIAMMTVGVWRRKPQG